MQKGPVHCVTGDLSPLSFTFFSLSCTIKEAKQRPLMYNIQITQKVK